MLDMAVCLLEVDCEKACHSSLSALNAIDSLVEIRLWDLEVSAVSDGLDGEDEGLSGEHGELTHHLPRVGHEQADGLLLVDHPLVDMQTTRQDEVQTHVLNEWREGEKLEKTEICMDKNDFAVLSDTFKLVLRWFGYYIYYIWLL